MKPTLSLTAATAVAILASTPAMAADGDWIGFHVGAGFGGAHSTSNLGAGAQGSGLGETYGTYACGEAVTCGEQDYFNLDAATASHAGKTSAFGTVEVGYDYQVGSKFVVGALANYDFAGKSHASSIGGGHWESGTNFGTVNLNGDFTATDNNVYDTGATAITSTVTLKDSWALGARAGALVNDKTLVYAAGGYTETKIQLDAAAAILPSPQDYIGVANFDLSSAAISTSRWKSGYFVGAGVETLLGNNLSAKLEYRYANYGSVGVSASDTFSVGNVSGTVSGRAAADDIVNHSLRFVLSYRL